MKKEIGGFVKDLFFPVILLLFGIGAYKWNDIVIFFKGKKIAIFGDIQTGKTTLHNFLRNGEMLKEHIATKRKTKVKKNRFKLNELELDIKDGTDIPGLNEYISEWKGIFKKSDICFYLFDTSKVYYDDTEYINKIFKHLSHIGDWRKEFKNKTTLVLIGTFADTLEEYQNQNKSNVQFFEQKIREKIKEGYLQASLSPSNIFIGSFKNEESMSLLVSNILISLKDKQL